MIHSSQAGHHQPKSNNKPSGRTQHSKHTQPTAISHATPGSTQLSPQDSRCLRWEILLILSITFGTSGFRAILRLIESLSKPEGLGQQEAILNQQQSPLVWLDPLLQLSSSAVLCAWGGLAAFLLLRHLPSKEASPIRPTYPPHPEQTHQQHSASSSTRLRTSHTSNGTALRQSILHGLGLAAIIGIPGLVFYITAVHLGLSKQVVPTGLADNVWRLPLLVINSWANGFAEETIVVAWLATRMRQLNTSWPWIFAASSLLRGSYHLYQGISAGIGNIIMGIIYLWYWKKTGKIWPLIIAHGLIDTLAFAGYALLGSTPGL